MIRKIISLAAVPAMVLMVLAASGIVSYFIAEEIAINKVTVGNNESAIEEVWMPPMMLAEGCDYEKGVYVKNTGHSDCYVRVFAETASPDTRNSILVDYNLKDWRREEDGYYYYKSVLKAGERTEHLFTTVHALKDVRDFKLIVYEETVQSDGFAEAEGAFEMICRK